MGNDECSTSSLLQKAGCGRPETPCSDDPPLSWGTTEENIENALQSGTSSVTIDITVVVGRKKTFLK